MARLTKEREDELRAYSVDEEPPSMERDWFARTLRSDGRRAARDLLAEIDALRAERDHALRGHIEPVTAVATDGSVVHGTGETHLPEMARQRDEARARANEVLIVLREVADWQDMLDRQRGRGIPDYLDMLWDEVIGRVRSVLGGAIVKKE